MPDKRQHRGPHPQDHELFHDSRVPDLRRAAGDLAWLLTRDYPIASALELVGNRFRLNARQRLAVARSTCSQPSAAARRTKLLTVVPPQSRLWIDGYNVLTSLEAALAKGIILVGRDGCFRDLASMHGSYRKVEETIPALRLLGEFTCRLGVHCRWLLDRPVSNSGRLKTLMGELAGAEGWDWQIELVNDPDPILSEAGEIVATSDSVILDHAERWFNLARTVIQDSIPDAWLLPIWDLEFRPEGAGQH